MARRSVDRKDDCGAQVRATAPVVPHGDLAPFPLVGDHARAARGEESPLFVVREYPHALHLVLDVDERVAVAEGVLGEPPLVAGDVQHAPHEGEFAVDGREAALADVRLGLRRWRRRVEPELFEATQIVMRDRAERAVAEVGDEHLVRRQQLVVAPETSDLHAANVAGGIMYSCL